MRFVKAPENRQAVSKIEEERNIEIEIFEQEELCKITSDDSILELNAEKAIEAYNIGFSPEESMELFQVGKELHVINLKKLCRNRKRINEQKGRVIGCNGRTKEIIQELTDTNIVLNGNKIGIVGDVMDVNFSANVITELIDGVPRSRIYKKMEKYKSS